MSKTINEEVKIMESKWKEIIESKDAETGEDLGFSQIKTAERKRHAAQLLENTEKEFLTEGPNNTSGMDIADPVLINLVRRTAPNLMAYDTVGVQPMKGPTGQIFAIRAHAGAQPVGPFGRPGDARTGHQTGSDLDSFGDTKAQGYGVDGKAPNELFYDEAVTSLTGTGTQTSNKIAPDYNAYTIGTGMSTATAETLGLQSGATWAEASITIDKTSVEAKERGMKATYTNELMQDMRRVHGLNADTEVSNVLSGEILAETNREVINTVRFAAKIAGAEKVYSNGSVLLDTAGAPVLGMGGLFDLDLNSDGRWSNEKHKSLLIKINKEANAIAKDSRRGRGNFIICSSDVASVLDLTGKMIYSPAIDNNLTVDDTGNTFVGMLQGRFKVFVDPYLGYDEVIVGYKGANQMDAGIFYCPYIPLTKYQTVDPATLNPVMGFKSRYGMVANPFTSMKANANNYFRKFKVTNL